ERRADEATRDVADWLKCDFMLDQIGQQFTGIITSVTGFGFFVRLNDLFIDGLVHVSTLNNDYYQYDNVGQRLIGESSGQVYRLGDEVEVKVEAVSMDERTIDFSLISTTRTARNPGKTARVRGLKGEKDKKNASSSKSRRRDASKDKNFEPDSAFKKGKSSGRGNASKDKAVKDQVAKDKASSKRKKASSQTKKIEAKLKAKRAAKRDNA
ncbi:S1 RNA-binding domain-containing protein, partial [Escherichia coli]|nr:S1 RNA-binding domain-containing protein [Escherichia coli]